MGIQTSSINSGPTAGFKNMIINGDFRVWQRGTSVSGSNNRPYTADMFRIYALTSGDSATHSRSTDVPSEQFEYSLQVDNVNNAEVNTVVELDTTGGYSPFVPGATYTLSYWAKGSDANWINTLGVRWSSFLSSGTLVTDTLVKGHTGGGGWEQVIHNVTIDVAPPGTATYMSILIGRDQSFTGTAYFTGFQLERGPVATEFERRPIGTELALCQRYYYTMTREGRRTAGFWIPSNTNSGPALMGFANFPVTMRTARAFRLRSGPPTASTPDSPRPWAISGTTQSGRMAAQYTPGPSI